MMDELIYQEILKYSVGMGNIMEGDISYEMIQDALKCSYDQAIKVGRRMLKSGEYEKLQVMGPERRITVFRKTTPLNPPTP